jgi:uncharacterized protein (TIGR01244 family)
MLVKFALIRSYGLALALIAGANLGTMMSLTSLHAQTASREVPNKEEIGALVVNYRRLQPQIATGGLLQSGAPARLKALGFVTIVDLRGPEEGTAAEKQAVEAAGLRYVNIPISEGLPSEAQLAEFGRAVEDVKNFPVLVHCVSANRVGAMWALYRTRQNIPLATAIAEGRAIGLQPTREADVRKRLQMTPAGVAADTRCEPGRC